MRILFLASWYGANPPRFLADVFEKMGHAVWRVGSAYRDHGGIDWSTYLPKIDLELRKNQKWDLPAYLEECTRAIGAPDFIIASEESYSNEIAPTDRLPVVLLSWDGWANSFARCDQFQSCLQYTAHPFGVRAQPREKPDSRWKFFGPACDPDVHRFLNVPRDIDWIMNATMYGARQEICDFLRIKGLSVRDGYVATDEYVMNANRGMFTYINSNHQIEIKWKFSENSAMGLVNICDDHMLYEWIGAKPYVHYFPVDLAWNERINEYWPTGQMIYDKIQAIAADPNLLAYVRENARNLAINSNTYRHRADMILQDLEEVGI